MNDYPSNNNFSYFPATNTCQMVFNLMQNFSGKYIVFDTRCTEDYSRCHIKQSLLIPFTGQFSSPLDLAQIKENILTDSSGLFEKRRRCIVILVFSQEAERFCRDLVAFLKKDRCREIYTLEESFDSYYKHYPFTCEGTEVPVYKQPRQGYPSEILQYKLYLGNRFNSEDPVVIDNLHITHIVNVTNTLECKFRDRGVTYLQLNIEDSVTAYIKRYFEIAFNFIDLALSDESNRVLVHCAQGVSRSATITIMYIMKKYTISFADALRHVKQQREIVCPNDGFIRQLQDLEKNDYEFFMSRQPSVGCEAEFDALDIPIDVCSASNTLT